MTRNTRNRRSMTIGVERLDQRVSLSGLSASPMSRTSFMTVTSPTTHLPPSPQPPTAPGTFINITNYNHYFLS